MTNQLSKYLEEAKIYELTDELEKDGYLVERDYLLGEDGGDARFDLVARKADKTVIYEIKAWDTLKESASVIARLRSLARDAGYNDFRLVIARPPRPIEVEVEDLSLILYGYVNEYIPNEFDFLPAPAHIDEVYDVDIDSLRVSTNGVSVSGLAMMDASLEFDGGDRKDGLTVHASFPFKFSLKLSQLLEVDSADLDVDTSSFYA